MLLTLCMSAEAYEGDQLRQLVAALCPTIYGHELVKAGLLLSLFGGVRKHGSSSNRVRCIVRVLIMCRQYVSSAMCTTAAAASSTLHAVTGTPSLVSCGNSM